MGSAADGAVDAALSLAVDAPQPATNRPGVSDEAAGQADSASPNLRHWEVIDESDDELLPLSPDIVLSGSVHDSHWPRCTLLSATLAAVGVVLMIGLCAVIWSSDARLSFSRCPPLTLSVVCGDEESSREQDYWASMVTVIRQCPASPSVTMELGAGSRWLVPPVPSIALYAFTIDEAGRRRDAVKQKGHPTGLLQEGVGYGAPEWEQLRQSSTASSDSAQQPGYYLTVEQILDRLRQMAPWNTSTVPVADKGTAELARLREVVDSYDAASDSPFRYRGQRRERPWDETTAPWFEVKLPGPAREQERLVFFGTELLPSSGARGSVAYTKTKVTLTQARDHANLHGQWHIQANRTLGQALLPLLQCKLVVDVDTAQMEQRSRTSAVNATEVNEVLAAVALHRPSVVVRLDLNEQSSPLRGGDAGYDLYCLLPHALSSSPYFMEQGGDGPLIRLRSLQFRPIKDSRVLDFGFRMVSLPLCTLRIRRSRVAAVLGMPATGPPFSITADHFNQWIQWHIFLGVEQVYLLDRFGSLYASLQPYMERGLLDYIRFPFLLPVLNFRVQDQIISVSFFLQHTRLAVDWVLQMDADEYFVPTHPYYTDNPHNMQSECHQRQPVRSLTAASSRVAIPSPEPCRSVLTSMVDVADEYGVRDFRLYSIPMMRASTYDNRSLIELAATRRALREEYGPLVLQALSTDELDSLGASGVEMLVSRLVWPHIRPLMPNYTVMDSFTVRLNGMDSSRIKLFFRPRHAQHVDEHGVVYNRSTPAWALQDGLTIQGHATSYFPAAGANHWRRHVIESTSVSTAMQPLNLFDLFCVQQPMEAFAETCCAKAGATRISQCLAKAVQAGNHQWSLALRSAYFPMSSAGDVPVVPLSIVGRIYHYICEHAGIDQSCSTVRMTGMRVESVSGNATDADDPQQAPEWEEGPDEASTLLRASWAEWRKQQAWLKL